MGTSARNNRLFLKFRTRNGSIKTYALSAPLSDGKWHRIIFALSGDQIQLSENCHQLIRKQDFDLHFERRPHLRMFVGERTHHRRQFYGHMREFSADAGNPTFMKCPNLDLMLASPVVTSIEETSTTTQQPLPYARTTVANELDERRSGLVDQTAFNQIVERVAFLEDQVRHWRAVIHSYDSRLKTIELHQRGCQIDGRVISFGEKQQNLMNCTECQCSSSGELFCAAIGCPHLKCDHPIKRVGQCCPECGKQCLYNGEYYQNGHEFWPKSCVRCACDDGRMECQFHQTHECPELDCYHQETPPNQCCPVCVGEDFCARNNPCHENADCINEKYGLKCKCKSGFFGNGTICYDIDECLWDESAREQLGGCKTGTICINLPGSFKCDCLPGFQKLDDKNCLDIIRV
ncbi:Protein kinase C-binding protein NELL1 [Toxocara canis]|uniref:Protein kinase C-binding protein NELL1 n=2 Tax=Toxocara canis TaxID=6265 RepID=A0A0B2UTG6_TOXCA|nr:Protein kinase C-binding protein NELL1 [Toxocara canis]